MDDGPCVSDLLRPQIKPELVPYVTVDGNVRIGSTIHGIGVEIEDPGGWCRILVDALDGTRSPSEILAVTLSGAAEVSETDVLGAMQQLLEAGFLDDAGAPTPAELSERERERYSRSMPFFRWMDRTPRSNPWDIQLQLRRSRVLLIGVGGAGGVVAQGLVASGVGYLHCVDSGTVELSNLNRQVLYREDDIGRPKIDVALAHLRARNSDVEITGEQREIADQTDIAHLLHPGYDLFVLCADQPRAITRWANRACYAAGLPWVAGGYHGPLASACVHSPGRGPCWECVHDQELEQTDMRLPPGISPDTIEWPLPWHPVNAVSASLTGVLILHAALALLTGAPPIEPGFRHEINLAVPGESAIVTFPPRPDCQTCGSTR